jgi:hypothetical protein
MHELIMNIYIHKDRPPSIHPQVENGKRNELFKFIYTIKNHSDQLIRKLKDDNR